MKKEIFLLLPMLMLMLEGSYTFLPLVLLAVLVLFIKTQKEDVFYIAFLAGIVLDLFTLRTLGTSSAFFLVCLFVIILYARKFEISTIPFVLISSFVGSFVFLIFSGVGNYLLILSILSSFIALLMFMFLEKGKQII